MELDYEREAMRNKPTPKGLDIVDTYAYMSLRVLYSAYRKGIIQRKEAADEKKKIIYNMADGKSKLKFLDRESDILSERIGEASIAYKENPSIENADKLYAAFYNLPDDWRQKNGGEKADGKPSYVD